MRIIPIVEFGGDLVPPYGVAGSARNDGHVVEAKRQQHGLLEPLIDPPGAVGRFLGHPRGAAVEQIERLVHRLAHRALGGRADLLAALKRRVDGFGQRLIGCFGKIGC